MTLALKRDRKQAQTTPSIIMNRINNRGWKYHGGTASNGLFFNAALNAGFGCFWQNLYPINFQNIVGQHLNCRWSNDYNFSFLLSNISTVRITFIPDTGRQKLSVSCHCLVFYPDFQKKTLSVVSPSGQTRTRQSSPDFWSPCPSTSDLYCIPTQCYRNYI